MSAEGECISNVNVEKCSVILLDIAGTTTSNNFVKDTLYPFAISNADEFLKSNWDREDIKEAVKLLKQGDEQLEIPEIVELVKNLTEKGDDNKGVKILQGLIYRKGYEDGKLKAHVFSDVSSSLEIWAKNYRIAVYSSGSIESQKLLFAHTTEGDLSTCITQYFDLQVGLKTETSSYEKIVKELSVKPEEVIFINDSCEELKAAKEIGISAVLVTREGNQEVPEDLPKEIRVIKCFTDLLLETSGKRKIDEAEAPEAPPTKVAKIEKPDSTDVKLDNEEPQKEGTEDEPMEVDSIEAVNDAKPQEIKAEANIKDDKMNGTDNDVIESEKTDNMKTEQIEGDQKITNVLKEGAESSNQDIEMIDKTDASTNEKSTESNIIADIETKQAMKDTKKPNVEPCESVKEDDGIAKITIEDPKQMKLPSTEDALVQCAEEISNSTGKTADSIEIQKAEKLSSKSEPILKDSVEGQVDSTKQAMNTFSASTLNSSEDSAQETAKDVLPTKLPVVCGKEENSAKVDTSNLTNSPATKEVKEEILHKTDNTEAKIEKTEDLKPVENKADVIDTEKSNVTNVDDRDIMEVVIKVAEQQVQEMKERPKLSCEDGNIVSEQPNLIEQPKEERLSEPKNITELPCSESKVDEEVTTIASKDADANVETKSDLLTKKPSSVVEVHGTEGTSMEICDTTADEQGEQTKSTHSVDTETDKDVNSQECSDVKISNDNSMMEINNAGTNTCSEKMKSIVIEPADDIKITKDDVETKVLSTEAVKSSEGNKTEIEEVENSVMEKAPVEKEVGEGEIKEAGNSSDTAEEKVNGNNAEKSSTNDEKENKSELANGTTSVENGSDVKKNGDVENATEEEIKVKKLEENTDSTPVSVEA